jgi:hypothetical protein
MRHQVGGHQRDAFRIAHQRRGEVRMQKCEVRSLVSSTFRIRHSTFSNPWPCRRRRAGCRRWRCNRRSPPACSRPSSRSACR